jgi:hypothetical protein
MNATHAYTAGCEAVQDFLHAWHENGRLSFETSYLNLDYDDAHYAKTAKDRKKFIALDSGTSGCYLLDKVTGEVWGIAGYGRPNRRYRPGNLGQMTETFRGGLASQPRPLWWGQREDVRRLAREATLAADDDPDGGHGALSVLADLLDDCGAAALAKFVRGQADLLCCDEGPKGRRERVEGVWRNVRLAG